MLSLGIWEGNAREDRTPEQRLDMVHIPYFLDSFPEVQTEMAQGLFLC